MIFEAINAEKFNWPIFGGNVGQSVSIVMKLIIIFDVPCHPPGVYTKFHFDISKHVEEKAEKLPGWSTSADFFSLPEGQKLLKHDENH